MEKLFFEKYLDCYRPFLSKFIGGIYFGWFTPTEGAAIGAVGAFLFALGRRQLGWKQFKNSLLSDTKTTGMIFLIILGALMFSYFLAVTRLPTHLAELMAGLDVSPYLVWCIIVVLYIFLGAVMDEIGMILLTVPILYPIVTSLGFDPIWFGITTVIVCEMGMIAPPVGMNVFVIKGMAQDVPTYTIYKGILPFLYSTLANSY